MFRKLLISSAALVLLAGTADATTFTFDRISNNSSVGDIGAQFSVEVASGGVGEVSFIFRNGVTNGEASSITDIYFDDLAGTSAFLSLPITITNSPGVSFSATSKPGSLPDQDSATPAFVTSINFSADSNPPVAPNGVNASSEYVTLTLSLANSHTVADVISSMQVGGSAGLRVGLHVQALPDGESDSYVNIPTPVPDSGMTASLLGLALAGMGVLRRRIR